MTADSFITLLAETIAAVIVPTRQDRISSGVESTLLLHMWLHRKLVETEHFGCLFTVPVGTCMW